MVESEGQQLFVPGKVHQFFESGSCLPSTGQCVLLLLSTLADLGKHQQSGASACP